MAVRDERLLASMMAAVAGHRDRVVFFSIRNHNKSGNRACFHEERLMDNLSHA